jgi:anaerobic selenocysteine-containing dehydrogenase
MDKVVRSNCRGCHGGCGVLVHVKGNTIIRIDGDPDFPTNRGSICPIGKAFPQLVHHPERLKYPLKRAGKRGEGKWQPISWDEALETIAGRYRQIEEEIGSEAIVLGTGTGREYECFLVRFANLLGTPNLLSPGHICYIPRVATTSITCGRLPVCDYEADPKCVMVWGNNVLFSNADEYKGINLLRAISKGAKLIVVDPRKTSLAGRADIWLQLRPGTDTALALGIASVIVSERLYDEDFVSRYTHGWAEFCERVQEYPPDRVEEITWVEAEKIKAAARLYARLKPACIHWGVAIEQSINCIDNNRILTDLMAITGNLDVPGGDVFFVPPPVRQFSQFIMHRRLSPEQKKKQLGGDTYKMARRMGVTSPKLIWDAILTGKPYSVKAMQLHGTNPLLTKANARVVYEALRKLEFLVVTDFFMTPTAELADLVLPAATWLEYNWLGGYLFRHGYLFPRRKLVQIGECWSDQRILNELGKKLTPADYWFDTVEDALDYILEPTGLSWSQVKDKPYLQGKMEYRKHEMEGFLTPTGKVELYSTILEGWGYDPLPRYQEPPESPISKPKLAEEYPYVLVTGARIPVFFHSEHRMIQELRKIHPDPIAEIHPQVAKKHRIKEGDWIFIESPRGKIRQKAKITTGIDPRVISAQHGWWFPELKGPGHGWKESNVNILTDDDPSGYDKAMGATNLRVLLCRISHAR